MSLAAVSLLFIGVLLSLTTRNVQRMALIEREPLPGAMGEGTVARISFATVSGLIMERDISVDALLGKGISTFRLYPPSIHNGSFVYMRYLGMAPLLTFKADDMSQPYASHLILMIYPPGREDSADIPGTDYRIAIQIDSPERGGDPYETADGIFRFKILKGGKILHSNSIPAGKVYSKDGIEVSFNDVRRVVSADLVRDNGVLLISCATVLLLLSTIFRIVVTLAFPRNEMLFLIADNDLYCYSSAFGRTKNHSGLFLELLDLLAGHVEK
jgi:hypothetical protein